MIGSSGVASEKPPQSPPILTCGDGDRSIVFRVGHNPEATTACQVTPQRLGNLDRHVAVALSLNEQHGLFNVACCLFDVGKLAISAPFNDQASHASDHVQNERRHAGEHLADSRMNFHESSGEMYLQRCGRNRAVADECPHARVFGGHTERRCRTTANTNYANAFRIRIGPRACVIDRGLHVDNLVLGEPAKRFVSVHAIALAVASEVECQNVETGANQIVDIIDRAPAVPVKFVGEDDDAQAARSLRSKV